MGTRAGVIKGVISRLGVSETEYAEHTENGEKRCSFHKAWHPKSDFPRGGEGISHVCLAGNRASARIQRRENPEKLRRWRRDSGARNKEAYDLYNHTRYANNPEPQRERSRAWAKKNPGKSSMRRIRRRSVPYVWEPLIPWPANCQTCGGAINLTLRYPHPMSGVSGHEPPIAWAKKHPEYVGRYIVRPEHWICNAHKSAKPDWEMKK